jgi:hypothetical protein
LVIYKTGAAYVGGDRSSVRFADGLRMCVICQEEAILQEQLRAEMRALGEDKIKCLHLIPQ